MPSQQQEWDHVGLRSLRLHCLCGLMARWHKVGQFQHHLIRSKSWNPGTFVYLGICEGYNFLAAGHFPTEIQLYFDRAKKWCEKHSSSRHFLSHKRPFEQKFVPVQDSRIYEFLGRFKKSKNIISVELFKISFVISQPRDNRLQKHAKTNFTSLVLQAKNARIECLGFNLESSLPHFNHVFSTERPFPSSRQSPRQSLFHGEFRCEVFVVNITFN